MRKLHRFISVLLLLASFAASSQKSLIDSAAFFHDEQPFEMVLSSDLKNLINKKMTKAEQPATVTMRFADSTVISEDIRINTRGKFRLENCQMPPILLNFKNQTSPRLRPLGKLKLVVGCGATNEDEQLIIKEYLAYKMYNMLTEKKLSCKTCENSL